MLISGQQASCVATTTIRYHFDPVEIPAGGFGEDAKVIGTRVDVHGARYSRPILPAACGGNGEIAGLGTSARASQWAKFSAPLIACRAS